MKAEEKSGEITAIPRLLDLPVLKGCIVTTDATGCQKETAAKITEKEAHYIPALKGNRAIFWSRAKETEGIFALFRQTSRRMPEMAGLKRAAAGLPPTEQTGEWKGQQCPVKVESVRYFKCSGKEEKDTRLYLSSVAPDARLISSAVRFHRLIENSLHWVPDVAFDEDNSRKRSGFAAQNYSVLNRIALNLLKNEKTARVGVRGKRLKAEWDNKYLCSLLKI